MPAASTGIAGIEQFKVLDYLAFPIKCGKGGGEK